MHHFTTGNRFRTFIRLNIGISQGGANSMVTTANHEHSFKRNYHDSKMEAKAPMKNVSFKKSGTLPLYTLFAYQTITEIPTTAPAEAPETKYVHQSFLPRIVY